MNASILTHPAVHTLGERIQRLTWWGQCILIWLAVLLVLSSVGLIAVRLAGSESGWQEGVIAPEESLARVWSQWDSGWYIALADKGYEAQPIASGFFPLYPLLMAALSDLTGWSLAFSGMLISQFSFLGAILALYKLARLIRDEHAFAMRTVLYLTLFPTSLFFFAVYAESLYLCAAIIGTYFALTSKTKYPLNGIAIGIASVARPVGFLLNIIAVAELIRRRDFRWKTILTVGLCLLIAGSGVIVYVIYLSTFTGSLTAITDTQNEGWVYTWEFPVVPIAKAVHFIFDNSAYPDWFSYVVNLVDLIFTLFALALTGAAVHQSRRRKFPWSLTLYMIGYLTFVLSRRGAWVPLHEMARWVAPIFPMYIVLAQTLEKKHRYFHWLVVGIFGAGSLLLTAWFATGRWVG